MSPTTTTTASPVGPLVLVADADGALTHLHFGTDVPVPGARPDPGPFAAALEQLEAYFAGERRTFDLPLAPAGTPFQQAAWAALTAIPFAETRSYGAQAAAIGRPRAIRAIGAANGRNPIAIVVPCHRVVGADGSLTGYGGGTDVKRVLLAHEQRVASAQLGLDLDGRAA